jgi:hypothetical protein
MTQAFENTTRSQALSLTNSISTTPEIAFGHATGGEVRIPAGSSITTLTWWSSDEPGGTYLPCYDAANSAVAQTVAHTQANALPAALLGRNYLKAVVNANGAVTIVTKG